MAKWFSEHPEYTEISVKEKAIRDRIVAVMERYTVDMSTSYGSKNPGVKEDDYEDIAEEIMKEVGIE